MKLDKDLIREILLRLELDDNPTYGKRFDVGEHSPDEVSYHVCILGEAGFIEADPPSRHIRADDVTDRTWSAKRLTYKGHEFLDTIRDNETWRLTKEAAHRVGTASLAAIFEIGKSFARQKLIQYGLHLG